MDEAFACPECGKLVEFKGLAPGRQVRCGFCDRLLEIPYIPRVVSPGWKRRRFVRPVWVPWVWGILGVITLGIVIASAVRFLDQASRRSFESSVQSLVADSESKEKSGDLAGALVDLDTALYLCAQKQDCDSRLKSLLRGKRQELARHEARAVVVRLSHEEGASFPVRDWLNLQARASTDPDLQSMKDEVAGSMQERLRARLEADLTAARKAFEGGEAGRAIDLCLKVSKLFSHLTRDARRRVDAEAEEIVANVIRRYGIFVAPPRGQLLAGSDQKYISTIMPGVFNAVRTRGYIPQPDSSPWQGRWANAPYRLTLDFTERLAGNYLASRNRLTRIEALVKLLRADEEIWKTTPTAQTMVPLPNLPAYMSSRVALSPDRIEEFEQMLYDNARSMIDEKLSFALTHMPECQPIPVTKGP